MDWRTIEGYPRYEVSRYGEVRNKAGKLLTQHPSDSGYACVKLLDMDGMRRWHRVHLLVLRAFHAPPASPQHQGCHEDGNKLNNHFENLAWKTPQENREDKKRHGTERGGVPGTRKLSPSEVKRILRYAWQGHSFRYIAKKLKVHRYTVSRVVQRSFKEAP